MKYALLVFILSLAANAGWENGNAGDVFVAEFELTAKDIVQRLELMKHGDKPVYDTRKLRALLAPGAVTVVSEPTVTLDGMERDAVNYYDQKLIKVNRSRWQQYRQSTHTRGRMRVVLHEYLPLSDVDDRDYAVSDHLIALINPSNFNPDTWWEPVNPVNFVATRLTQTQGDCALPMGDLTVSKERESLTLDAQGDCGEKFRRVRIDKVTGITPVSSNIRGKFHKFRIRVFDGSEAEVGRMEFEPAWGECLLPEVDGCRGTGKMTVGGVEFVFWFLRK